ncbi:TPA: hypothetical protein JBJ69_14300 [Legionella pneumophila]|nr:hypothetical protein [Legionella pneumophila subsp. pneumophila]HAU1838914.1 hypothetical protein [Legionella pneumophila]HBD9292395.1 hypothetical protein [Legionella pneumophila]HDU8072143.1 hypothetical protein [Legionella pneumophila]HDZ9665740.1 hypothetical protein [Legionella pneumophila]
MPDYFSFISWSLIKDIVNVAYPISIVTLGILGLTTWKRQLRGSHQFEISKKILTHAYKVQQSIKNCRNPMLYLSKDEVDKGNALAEKEKIYSARYSKLNDEFIELHSLSLEAKVIFGDMIDTLVSDLNKVIAELKSELWLFFWLQGYYAEPGTEVDNNPERVKQNSKIVFWISDDDDFSKKVAEKISNIENFLYQKVLKQYKL